MSHSQYRRQFEELLSEAGININGDRPEDIRVHNEALYKRVFAQGSLGFGESYMDGWWDCEHLDALFHKILLKDLHTKLKSLRNLLAILCAKVTNPQKRSRAFQIGERHYDTGNKLFSRMLDRSMNYSCAYWRDQDNLDNAQQAKMDLICRKLQLAPGMKLLDIGCGWGSMAKYAAEHYGAIVMGVTVSKEQAAYAQESCKGLPVEIRLEDYRSIFESFDRVVSVGMFEHVGYKNYPTFMEVCRRNLKDDGLFLLHTIGGNQRTTTGDPWVLKYIFPNSMIPSPTQVCDSIENRFILEDWHNFGMDYERTLLAWVDNFDKHWQKIKADYSERFYRMWKYYLLSFTGAFRARRLQLWQLVLSPSGIPGGYIAPR